MAEWVETPDDDRLRVHVAAGEEDAPAVLLLHGLEGSVRSNYIQGLASRFVRRGWTVLSLEFRSCSGEINRSRRLYHLGETSDLEFIVGWALERFSRPLYVSGVSLSGNVLAKWLGERGRELPPGLRGAAATSLPFDLELSGPTVDRALGGLYSRRFLRTLIPKAVAKERQYPGLLDTVAIRQARTMEDFDTLATAPLHGFEDAWDYWRKVSCAPLLHNVRLPMLLVAARDDPFNPEAAIPFEEIDRNPCLTGLFPQRGGHVGFVAGVPWRTRHWAEEAVEAYFVWLEGRTD